MKRRICVIGTGYVGMACSLGLSSLGHHVIGFDILHERIEGLLHGETPYHEAGLGEILKHNLASGRLEFTHDEAYAVRDVQAIIICVGTPPLNTGASDLHYLDQCVERLQTLPLAPGTLVILRSTVPPGTSDRIAALLEGKAQVLFCPEFLREGHALEDFLRPDRHLIGATSSDAAKQYMLLIEKIEGPVVIISRTSAEVAKLASNAFLAMKISFANEIANFSNACNADGLDVLDAMGRDHRIGSEFLQPGIGFGGPCFDKDLRSYTWAAQVLGVPTHLALATLAANAHQPVSVVDMLETALGHLKGVHVGVWGLTFKAGTDDMRGSLTPSIIEDLVRHGARVTAFDPSVQPHELPWGCTSAETASHVLDVAVDALLVLTEWPEFAAFDSGEIAAKLLRKTVVDGRNVLDGKRLAELGVRYLGIGRTFMPTQPANESCTIPPIVPELRESITAPILGNLVRDFA